MISRKARRASIVLQPGEHHRPGRLALLRKKIETNGLSHSERDFVSTPEDSAERSLKKGYVKTMGRSRFGD